MFTCKVTIIRYLETFYSNQLLVIPLGLTESRLQAQLCGAASDLNSLPRRFHVPFLIMLFADPTI